MKEYERALTPKGIEAFHRIAEHFRVVPHHL